MPPSPELMDHAWRYLTLHSTQRLMLFRFYIFIAAFLTVGIVGCLGGSAAVSVAGVGFGVVLVCTTAVFWKLDQRTSLRVRQGEATLLECERQFPRGETRPFSSERTTLVALTKTNHGPTGTWSYSRITRAAFVAGTMFGAIGTLLFIARALASR